MIARLCEPASELHIAEDWYRATALEDLLGIATERIDDHRLYRTLDRLLPHKAAIEQHLRQRLGEPFALAYDLLLYDVISTYFEGPAARNTLAARGYSPITGRNAAPSNGARRKRRCTSASRSTDGAGLARLLRAPPLPGRRPLRGHAVVAPSVPTDSPGSPPRTAGKSAPWSTCRLAAPPGTWAPRSG